MHEALARPMAGAGFVGRDVGDRIDLERRADLVGQVVDEVELAVAVEGFPGERALVGLAGARVGQHRGDAPAGRGPSTQPTVAAVDHDRMAFDRARRPARRPTWRSRMTPPSRSVIVTRASVPPAGPTASGRRGDGGRSSRRSSAASIEPAPTPRPEGLAGPRSRSSGSNGLVRYWSAPAARPCSRS